MLSMICIFPATAQETASGLDEIIVTAQARSQPLQNVPLSIISVDGAKLQNLGIDRIEDFQNSVPSLNYTETGISTNIFLRGLGSGVNQGFEQSVATFVDGVFFGRAQSSREPFLDLAQVDVLRGAQTLFFGKNAIGGAINIQTAKPTDTFEAYVRASYEIIDSEASLDGAVSGPLSEKVRARIAGRFWDGDGYSKNTTLNRDEAQREGHSFRAQVEADISDTITALVKVENARFDVLGRDGEITGEAAALAGPFSGQTFSQLLVGGFGADASVLNNFADDIRSSNGDNSFNDTETYVLSLDWDIDGYQLISTTALTRLDYTEVCDCDFTGASIISIGIQEEFEQFSQELRLISPISKRFDYLLGGYFQTTDQDYADQIRIGADSLLVPIGNNQSPGAGSLIANTQAARLATVNDDSYSAFAQLNWHLKDNLTLQLGGRLSYETQEGNRDLTIEALGGGDLPLAQTAAPLIIAQTFGITSNGLAALGPQGTAVQSTLGVLPVTGSRSETDFSPDIKLQYQATPDHLFYVGYTIGRKSGGFDFRANNKGQFTTLTDSFTFDPERAETVEIGSKARFLDDRAELNIAGYYTQVNDLQVSVSDGLLGFNVQNVAAAKVKGLELDGRFIMNDNLQINGALAATDFDFTDFENGQCFFGAIPDASGFCSYTGESQQMLSDFTGSIGADWSMLIKDEYALDIHGDVYFASEYNASATYDPALVQEAFAKVNLRAAISSLSDKWEIALLAKNLTDKRTLNFGGDTPLAGPLFGLKSNYVYRAQGRTLTAQVKVGF